MKYLWIFIFFCLGVFGGVRMVADPAPAQYTIKIKDLANGAVSFVPEDSEKPYEPGDIYVANNFFGNTYYERKFIVLARIKVK